MAANIPTRRLRAREVQLLPQMRPAGTRGAVLEASLRLFAERGYAGTSLRDIAGACQIKAATVYSHYPSKEHILAELCRLGHAEHTRLIRAALLEAGSEPSSQVVAFVHGHVAMHTRFAMLAVVANAELHMLSPELGAQTFQLREQTITTLTEIVQRGRDRGDFDVADTWLATAAIGGMGLRVAYWFDPEGDVDPAGVAEQYAEFALRLLRAPPANTTMMLGDLNADFPQTEP